MIIDIDKYKQSDNECNPSFQCDDDKDKIITKTYLLTVKTYPDGRQWITTSPFGKTRTEQVKKKKAKKLATKLSVKDEAEDI